MMAVGAAETLERARPVMDAVGANIHVVGAEPGMGQTVKACLQSLIGSVFTATFEASVLAAKGGVDAQAPMPRCNLDGSCAMRPAQPSGCR